MIDWLRIAHSGLRDIKASRRIDIPFRNVPLAHATPVAHFVWADCPSLKKDGHCVYGASG